MALSIAFESSALQASLGAFPRQIVQAGSKAINGALFATRAFMLGRMAAATGVPELILSKALRVERATPERLSGEVTARTKAGAKLIPILQLRARQIGRGPDVPGGVVFQFAGQSKTIPNGFIATMRSGHRGVFTRVGRTRLPIIEEKGPAVRTLFELSEDQGRAFAERDVSERLERELQAVADRV